MSGHRPEVHLHFVLKRGHLGRYRFTFMMDGSRLTGEVQTGSGWADRAKQDQHAYNEIVHLAESLAVKATLDREAWLSDPDKSISDRDTDDPGNGC